MSLSLSLYVVRGAVCACPQLYMCTCTERTHLQTIIITIVAHGTHAHTHTYLRTVCATYECVVEILSDGWIYPLYAKAFTSIVICLKLKFWQMVSFLHLAQTHIRIHTYIYIAFSSPTPSHGRVRRFVLEIYNRIAVYVGRRMNDERIDNLHRNCHVNVWLCHTLDK